MIRLSALLCSVAAVAWWLGREHEWRLWVRACETPQDEMDAVQPADPVTVHQVWPGYQWLPSSGYGTGDFWPNSIRITSSPRDWSYTDAITRAAIRHTAQSADRPTEGMS